MVVNIYMLLVAKRRLRGAGFGCEVDQRWAAVER
jgi:hypothetical protein